MSKDRVKLSLTILLLMFSVYSTSSGNHYQNGLTALKAGKIDEAAVNLEKALKNDPSNPVIKLAYASILEPMEAEKVYQELASNDSVADSIRAEALSCLGSYFYVQKKFKESADFYRRAANADPKPVYRHSWALAVYGSGDEEAAQSIWYTLSLEYGDNISRMAQYYLGLIHFKRADYDKAYSCFLKTGNAEPENAWTIAALAGKLECAAHLGMADKVELYTTQLKPYKHNLLERDLLQLTISDNIKLTDHDKTDEKTGSNTGDSRQLFTLQVGAFGSPENASNLQKKLSENFEDVTVIPVTHSDQVFYRVRTGTFSSREEAEKYGKKELEKSGLNYQVVPK